MSIVIPHFHWMATGSKTSFKEEILTAVKNYKIIAYPDKTEYTSWNNTATQLNKQGFTIQCSSLLEKIDLEKGSDLVDFLSISLQSRVI